jgi:hypothetical protein
MPRLVRTGPGPVIPARAFGTGPGADAVPGAGGQGRGDVIGAQPALAARPGRDAVAAGDRQDITQAESGDPRAEGAVVAIHLVSRHPRGGHPRPGRLGDHLQGQLRLGRELHLRRDAGRGAPLRVIGPGLRQVDPPVDQRPAARRGAGQEHADLGVLDPPGRAAVLALHARRAGALLQEPGLITNQHPSRVTEPGGHEPANIITDRISIPGRGAQQPLHRLRIPMTGLLRQPPAVLALGRRQQPQHELPGGAPRFHPREPARDQEHQLIEQHPPAGGVYAVASGHRKIIGRRHNPA